MITIDILFKATGMALWSIRDVFSRSEKDAYVHIAITQICGINTALNLELQYHMVQRCSLSKGSEDTLHG